MDAYGGETGENDLIRILQLSDRVRDAIQDMIFARLAERRPVFFG